LDCFPNPADGSESEMSRKSEQNLTQFEGKHVGTDVACVERMIGVVRKKE